MDLTEKCLESREVYKGRVLRLRVDTVALPNGKTSLREVVEHPGGVGILALDENGCVPMVTQYRYAFSRTLLEIPAGKREPGEEPFVTAQRELKEEVGATAADWQPLGQIIASPGCYDEVLHLPGPGPDLRRHPSRRGRVPVRPAHPLSGAGAAVPQRRDSGRQNRHRRAEGKVSAGAVIFPKKQWTRGISCGNMRN